MKRILIALLCASLIGCTTDQLNAFGSAAKPIADAAVDAAAAYYHLPPDAAPVINAARDSLWGAAVQKWGRQPAAQGAVAQPIGAAIQNALPVMSSTSQQAVLLQQAARQLETVAGTLPAGQQ